MIKPEECLHTLLHYIKDGKGIVELNGHGMLVPAFKCDECGTMFFRISHHEPTKKPASDG